MNKERLIETLRKGNNFLQTPIEFQMALLGLNEKVLKSLGKTGLDIGCGNGALVEKLREQGISFEGIDAIAPRDKEYFMPQNIYGMSPMEGAIPREDKSYDIVTAFQCGTLNRGFTFDNILRNPRIIGGTEQDQEFHTKQVINANFIVYEAIRVIKPRGKIVIYPSLTRLEETIGYMLKKENVRIYTEQSDRDTVEEYFRWESQDIPPELFEIFREFGLYERTVIQKN